MDSSQAGGMLRSEVMLYASLVTNKESAIPTLHAIAKFGLFELNDLSRDFEFLLESQPLQDCKRELLDLQRQERVVLSFIESCEALGIETPRHPRVPENSPPGLCQRLGVYFDEQQAFLRQQEATQLALQKATEHIKKELWVLRIMQAVDFSMDSRSPVELSRWIATPVGFGPNLGSGFQGSFPDEDVDFESQLGEPRFGEAARRSSYGSLAQHRPVRSPDRERDPQALQSRWHETRRMVYGLVEPRNLHLLKVILWRLTRGNFVFASEPLPELLLNPDSGEGVLYHAFWAGFASMPIRSDDDHAESKSAAAASAVFDEEDDPLSTPSTLLPKWRRVLQSVGAFAVDYPRGGLINRQETLLDDLDSRLQLLKKTEQQIRKTLEALAVNAEHPELSLYPALRAISREQTVLDGMRKCDVRADRDFVRIDGWLPVAERASFERLLGVRLRDSRRQGPLSDLAPLDPRDSPDAEEPLQDARHFIVGEILPRAQRPASAKQPPTFFRTTPFTQAFQSLVDTYGVPSYREVNPALFTIVTFPFLYGVMYGDVGHGSIMFLAILAVLWNEKKLAAASQAGKMDEMMGMVFGGRYMILLMSLFSVFCGSIYNDVMAVPLSLFQSGWSFNETASDQGQFTGHVYPWGVDPAWYHTKNHLAFMNSLKMKLSVILGVVHMSFGLSLALMNHVARRDFTSVWFDWLPRQLFLLCTFGYMIFIIIVKWTIDWPSVAADPDDPREPPSLVQTMVNMFLSPTANLPEDQQMFAGQGYLQLILIMIAFACVPTLLLGGPLALRKRMRNPIPASIEMSQNHPQNPRSPMVQDDGYESKSSEDETHVLLGSGRSSLEQDLGPDAVDTSEMLADMQSAHHIDPLDPESRKHYSFGEQLILQAIHTIEFVLGCVSNTASYLRLWALSLAHAQLADVFWQKLIVEYGLSSGNAFVVVITFSVWCAATVGVLLCMDALECFLHALRLHWVEFQSKFFEAQGYAFSPLSYSEKARVPEQEEPLA